MFLGTGLGTFKPAVSYSAGPGPVSIATGDVNGDGHVDLAIANNDANSVTLLLGNGLGKFTPGSTVTVATSATGFTPLAKFSDGLKAPFPFPKRTLMPLASRLAVTTSILPSRLKSPTTSATGLLRCPAFGPTGVLDATTNAGTARSSSRSSRIRRRNERAILGR